MATLIPASPSFDTRGEERLAQRFKEKLDSECWLWYNIPVGRKQLHPDFVVLHPSRGMLVLEVKDWHIDTLIQANKIHCTIEQANGVQKVVENPLEQARACALELVHELQNDAMLLEKEGRYKGNLIFPWTYATVLTHITRQQFEEMGLHQAMEPHHVICKDEMEPSVAAEELGNRLWKLFPYELQQPLTMLQRDRVRWVLFPDVRTMPHHLPQARPTLGSNKLGNKTAVESVDVHAVMNVQQEQLARSLGDGHRVLHGVAGSGKTLILCSRAQHLARLGGGDNAKPILILCFNRPLAARLEAFMHERDVGKKVVVQNFHKWCRDQLVNYRLDLPRGTDLQNTHYAEDLVQLVMAGVADGKIPTGRYQAVLIDEGHDFEEDWLRLAVQMVDPATNNFLLVYDGSQSVFKQKRKNFTFKSVGIQAQGRSRPVLKINYRNPLPVLQLASQVAGEWLHAEDATEDGVPIAQPMSYRNNAVEDPPIFIEKPNLEKEIHAIADALAKANRQGYAWREMAVLYARWDCRDTVIHVLTQRQIPFQNYKAGISYNPNVDAISVMGMKVSKGLEFAVVALPGVGYMPASEEDEKEAAQMFYVAATRATKQLIVGVDGGGKGAHSLLKQTVFAPN